MNRINKQNKKFLYIIISGTIFFLTVNSCELKDRLNNRLNDEKALNSIREIRNAESIFYKSNNQERYGTLTDLTKSNLVSNDLADGISSGYEFRVEVNISSYNLDVCPLTDSNGDDSGESCYFMNQTGIIRASDNAKVKADENSGSINNQ